MSLRFDVSAIANKDEVCNRKGNPEARENPEGNYWAYATESIAYTSMVVSYGSITEANYRKWYERYVMFQLAIGEGKDLFLSLEDVRQHIGFKVNVADYTDAAYRKWIISKIEERAKEVIFEQEKAKEAGEQA